MNAITKLARGSVEAGSVKTYRPGLNKFTAFVNHTCAYLGRPPWPHESVEELRDLISSKGVVEAFIAYAHEDGLRSSSIDVYISALKFWGTDGFGRPILPDSNAVKRLLQGCEKAQGPPKDGKLGIGIIRLRRLTDFLGHQRGWSAYEVSLWRAMFCAAFFAASRVSEYLETADEVKLLTPDKVKRLENGGVRFILYKTKNNSVGRPQEIDFPKLEGEEACPASAILSFLKLRESGDPKLPLFVDKGGRAVCPERFNDKLKELMGVIEPTLKGRFTSKSFRIGITSDAYALGVAEADIGNLGRWAVGSKAYMSYVVSLSRAERATGVQRLVSQVGRTLM